MVRYWNRYQLKYLKNIITSDRGIDSDIAHKVKESPNVYYALPKPVFDDKVKSVNI